MLPFKSGVRVTSPFGMRTLNGVTKRHNGIDLVPLAAGDDEVLAVADGRVTASTRVTNLSDATAEWGHYVAYEDAAGNRYYNCHLKSRAVKAGDVVKAGQVVGVKGGTGKTDNSYAPHLHFEARHSPYTSGCTLEPAVLLGIQNAVGEYPPKQTEEGGGKMYVYDVLEGKKPEYFNTGDVNDVGGRLEPGKYAVLQPEVAIAGYDGQGVSIWLKAEGREVYAAVEPGKSELHATELTAALVGQLFGGGQAPTDTQNMRVLLAEARQEAQALREKLAKIREVVER